MKKGKKGDQGRIGGQENHAMITEDTRVVCPNFGLSTLTSSF